jgi:hypothetical protein
MLTPNGATGTRLSRFLLQGTLVPSIPETRKPSIIQIYGPDRRLDQRPRLNPGILPFGILAGSSLLFPRSPEPQRLQIFTTRPLQMDGPDSFGTPPSYHMTLSCDLGLIHRACQGFVYRDFMTCEDEGSCPLVSRVPKRQNLFTLNRFGVSYTGIS